MSDSTRPQGRRINPLTVVLGLSAAFFVFFLMVSGVLFLSKSAGGPSRGASLFGGGYVGIVELNGVIMDSKKILKRLEQFEEDEMAKAVVLRLNSPGGSVAPSQEIYEAVKSFKKPLVVSMGSVAASGAYYISCAAKKVFANPGTITGSIGVIMEFINLEKLYDWARVHRYALKTGKYKGMGSDYKELSAEERTLLQAMLDDVLSQFKQAVATGRKLKMDDVTRIADGRIFSGSQAKTLKLVDELGTLQDAINEAAKLAQLKGKPKVVYPEKQRRRWLDFVLDDGLNRDESESSLGHQLAGVDALFKKFFSGSVKEEWSPGVYWLWNGSR